MFLAPLLFRRIFIELLFIQQFFFENCSSAPFFNQVSSRRSSSRFLAVVVLCKDLHRAILNRTIVLLPFFSRAVVLLPSFVAPMFLRRLLGNPYFIAPFFLGGGFSTTKINLGHSWEELGNLEYSFLIFDFVGVFLIFYHKLVILCYYPVFQVYHVHSLNYHYI